MISQRGRWTLFTPLAAWILVTVIGSIGRAEPFDVKVMSFNVLVEFSNPEGVPPWSERRDLCAEAIRKERPDLLGLQEPTPRQVTFFAEKLPEFDHLVFPRYNYTDVVLLFRKDVFENVEWGHWWLSKTPDKPLSAGFGNSLPRLLIWARLKHKPTGREIFVFNTHFDNTMPSQVKMAALCQEKMASFREKNLPMIWMGDFNTSQTRGDYPTLVSNGWKDSYVACEQASPDGRDDNVSTFPGSDGKRIDHIFYHGPIKPVEWRRIESSDPAKLLSDHYPIAAKLRVE